MEEKNLGYVKLWRKIAKNPIWLQEPFTKGQAWVDLFLLANHKNGFITIRGNIISIKRGQLGWSKESLGERWKWSRGKVNRYLKWLETIQQIIQQKSHLISLITIKNYETYQKNNTPNDTTDDTTDGQQTVQQTDTNNNDKNVKNEKNTDEKVIFPLNENYDYFIKSPQRHIQIIGLFAQWINHFITNKGELKMFISRHCRDAQQLADSKIVNEKLEEEFVIADKESNNGQKYRWTLHTIIKNLTK